MKQFFNSKHQILLFLLIIGSTFVAVAQTDYLPVGATVNKLSTDQFGFLEGPVWYQDSVLLFSELGSTFKIFKYSPRTKTFSVYKENLQKTNGLTLNKEGMLLACEESAKRIISIDGNVISALATSFNGTAFNKPNDLIADAKGGIYFTDPANAVVYYVSPTGVVSRIITDITKPNGILLSPDGSELYVSDTQGKDLYAWSVASDGTVSNKVKVVTLNVLDGKTTSTADGMAIDIHGNIYVTTELGIQVISANGTHLGTIVVPEQPANCDFGGADMKTLYITAKKNLYKIDLNCAGFTVFKNKTSLVDKILLQNKSFTMFPIPARECIQYKINESANHQIMIFDAVGKCVKTISGNGNVGVINVNNLAAGMYSAQLWKTDLKRDSFNCRFIVTK